ncbi:hypothetical protein RIF29_36361 [Crotalaria pallida]|uniref:RST domain-containing protein n=1 Tax=Crotalaria pallida TaxID=3830 RepID=A0AAN9EBD6_CROPI
MPFPLFFAAIKGKIPSKDMELIIMHYQEYKAKKMTREDFVLRLRLIVGDTLIRDTVTRLQCKIPTKPSCELKDSNVKMEG